MAEHHFSIESTQINPTLEDSPAIQDSVIFDTSKDTAHLISNDAWYQAGFVLVTSLNSVFALGYSGIIMVPLGWIGGTVGLISVALISLYANHLLARLQDTGGKRHIRYRDLAGHIYGIKMYYITWTLQYINLFMVNIGFIIFAGEAMKAVYIMYSTESMLKLPYCITITGLVCIIFAYSIPHLSALRLWLGVSTVLSLIYIIVSIVLSIKDGSNSPPRDYGIPKSKTTKIFSAIGAAASLCFAYNSGMLPEIQIFASPTYEYLDTKFGWRNESIYSMKNWAVRLLARGMYLGLATFVAALLPFLGDFVNLTSAITLLPLTFVLANHMYIKVKGNNLNALQKSWHWANIWFFTLFAMAGAVSAFRQIVIDSKTYHLFADL